LDETAGDLPGLRIRLHHSCAEDPKSPARVTEKTVNRSEELQVTV
jgi:hypothetical protein